MSPPQPPIISVTLAVPDAARAAEWYKRALGAEQPFDVRGEIVVTENFTEERRIAIGISDFTMRKTLAKGTVARRTR